VVPVLQATEMCIPSPARDKEKAWSPYNVELTGRTYEIPEAEEIPDDTNDS
jgi:hypothetical protein